MRDRGHNPTGADPAEPPTDGLGPSLLRRLGFGVRLGLAFGTLLLLVAVTAGVSFHGLRKVQAEYEQALGFGVALDAKCAKAREVLQDARRHEKEFLLRWREVGVARARDAWIRRPPTMAVSDVYPEDTRSTVMADLGEFRATLADIAKLLHAQPGNDVAEDEADRALPEEIKGLAQAADVLQSSAEQVATRLWTVVHRLERRGDLAVERPGAPAPTSPGLPAERPTEISELHKATDAIAAAIEATPVEDADPSQPTQHAPTQQVDDRLAFAQLQLAQQGYLGRQESGLPFRLPPGTEENAGKDPQANAADATPTSVCAGTAPPDDPPPGEDQAQAVRQTQHTLARRLDDSRSASIAAAVAKHIKAFEHLRGSDRELHAELRAFLCAADAAQRQLDVFGDLGPKTAAILATRARNQAASAAMAVNLVSLLCLLLGSVLAVTLARDIRVPIRELATTARQVASGNLDARAWVYSSDEIGQFAQTFNQMTERLQSQNTHIAKQMQEIAEERDLSERLLLNVLPLPIAERLKSKEHPIADAFAEASVLFADVVGYTILSARLPPTQVVERLSQIFSAFDAIAAQHGVEKIKTMGDAYMAACGLPRYVPDHAQRIADMALDMLDALERINRNHSEPLRLRIGLNCGPVVAGVIGDRKFIYDLWGDTVNVASRMESHGVPGAIQLPAAMHERIAATHWAELRGVIEVKGKGPMETWFLLGRTTKAAPAGGLAGEA